MTENRTHACDALRSMIPESGSYGLTIEWEEGAWQLCYASYAIDSNVRAGEADSVGEIMSGVDLAIYFCPYCGEALPPGPDTEPRT